jgi:hypothetical protein
MAKTSQSKSSPTLPTPQQLAPEQLLLDPFNPRLPPARKGKGQESIIEVMLDDFAIDELAESICSAGFLALDPFIGYREGNKVFVLEGNRRLATIKLLLDAKLTPPRYSKTWDDFRSRLTPDALTRMQSIPILIYSNRHDANVLAYIGYRHVNGVLNWKPEEKASFIAQLIEDPQVRWTYSEVANKIGSKAGYVEKLYVAHRLIEQAQEDNIPGASSMRSAFGVLTRALQSPGVTRFLGITFPGSPAKSKRPATRPRREVEDFVRWTFGTEDNEAVLEDSRDLTKWGQILDSEDAIRYLRTTKDPRFDRAFSKSGGEKESIVDSLMAASDRIAEAVPLVRQHRKEEDVIRAVARCADFIAQILAYFPNVAEEQGLRLTDVDTSAE